MGLETAEFIAGLTESWPLGTDLRREGDDHLRLIKRVLKNTFPNMNAQSDVTPAQLNGLAALTGTIAQIIEELKLHIMKPGYIFGWDVVRLGSTLPEGIYLCNGQNVAGYGVVPNMVDKFVVGAGSTYAGGDTGGEASKTSGEGGGHTPVIQGHALTTTEIPAHEHGVGTRSSNASTSGGDQDFVDNYPGATGSFDTESVGGGQAHTHGADAVPDHTHDVNVIPPYYAMVWVIKCSDYEDPAE